MKTTQNRYYVKTAYACNDLARARQGSQDIIGYDVCDRTTAVVEIPCDTEEEANAECARLNAASANGADQPRGASNT